MTLKLDFDPDLPLLPFVFDLEFVSMQLSTRKGLGQGFTDDRLSLQAIKLLDVKYRPSSSCLATYEVDVTPAGGRPYSTIAVFETSPDGIKVQVFTQDSSLPGVAVGADLELMQKRFAELGGGLELKAIEPVRYRPGMRCVFRYRLQTIGGERAVYGKVLHDNAHQLALTIDMLHRAGKENYILPVVPPLLAWWSDLNMVVQVEAAGGREFSQWAFDPNRDENERTRRFRQAGEALAALHQSTFVAPIRSFEQDIDELKEYSPIIAKVMPQISPFYEELLTEIEVAGKNMREATPRPGHGALRTNQLLLIGHRLAMIDLDGFCLANPARDIGNFLAYLRWKAILRPDLTTIVESAGHSFLDSYQASLQGMDIEWQHIYQAVSLMKIAGRKFRSLAFHEWPYIHHLLNAGWALIRGSSPQDDLSSGQKQEGFAWLI